jgi:hypothetical protein
MPQPNGPKNWKLIDVEYRTRYLLYQMFTSLTPKDRNASKAHAEVVKAIKCGEDDLLPVAALDGSIVAEVAKLLKATGVNEAVVTDLANALKATNDTKDRATIHLTKEEVDEALQMYDEFLKDANALKSKEGNSAVGNLAKMGANHRVIDVIVALESAKAGTATPGLCEAVRLDGAQKPELPTAEAAAA